MKPLERGQLKNWNDYLEYEIKKLEKKKDCDESEQKDGQDLVTVLFERCLIACALYEDFWIKYANWLRGMKGDHSEQIR